jgi:curved DNA-binding protein CbpA
MHTTHPPASRVPVSLMISLAAFSFSGHGLIPGEAHAKEFNPDNPLNAPAPIYWCPGKTQDQQISTKKGGGCEPLYDQQANETFRNDAQKQGYDLPDRDPIKIVELQNESSKFSERYRNFLSCCVTSDEAPAEIIQLIDEANHILKAVQQKGIYNSAGFGIGSRADGSPGTGPGNGTGNGGLGGGPGRAPKLGTFARQYTLSEIVGTVARARKDLFSLRDRLEKLKEAHQELESADYERSGRVKQQLHDEEEAIRKEFSSKRPPSSAPTGMEIQDTTLRSRIGGDIEDTKLNANFGADIGASVSPYSNVGESLRPRRGADIHDSQLSHRPGTDLQDTTMPSSTGFEIDNAQNREGSSTIQRRGVGPSIGDSDFNTKSR